MEKNKIRTFAKLGYSHLDMAEIVSRLNKLLASYYVYFQKLRNFHWNIQGPDFFHLHRKFMEMYQAVDKNIDEIAGKIRLFGKFPFSTLDEFLAHSLVKEASEGLSSVEMVKEILDDIRTILSLMEECIHSSKELGDYGTEHMMKMCIQRIENDHWMLTAWLNEPTITQ